EKVQDLSRGLMCCFWAGFPGPRTVEAVASQPTFGFVDGGSRQAEIPGDLAQRLSIGLMSSERFIFDLEQVTSIEEAARQKKRMADFVGMGMRGVTVVEGL